MNIQNLIDGGATVYLLVSQTDLLEFGRFLIAESKKEAHQEKKEETFLTPNEVASMVSVSKNTLWRWERDGYLKPIKVGRKNRYKLSDVKALMEGER